ncbi:MAG: TspO/MBR family protein [archaeon]|jgi:tryptophan-rich sensory protein
MNKLQIAKLIALVIFCEIIGAIGTIFTIPNIPTWYASLVKPFFSPPNWLFAPVWTILFLMMGVSLYFILENKNKKLEIKRKIAIAFFGIQFIFNILWSYLFFGLRNPLFGFIGIIFLWISILATIISFYKIDKKSAYLLVPYLLWVSFATILNFAVFILN